ncbi:MAG: PilZ domain-containing protein [Candidatus Omnitrophica bacterium]|nr:PilZ domain-containing protein [Candidatus Omnitrophota bacterium]
MKERRQYIRISKFLEVTYRIADGFLRSGSRSIDVSGRGIRLPTFQRLEPRTILELEIRLLESRKSIVATGEVAWLREKRGKQFPYEIGIKFIKIAPIDCEILNNFCKRFEENLTDIGQID